MVVLLFSRRHSQSKPHQQSESTFGVVSYSSAEDTVSISPDQQSESTFGLVSYSSAGDTVSLSLINRVSLLLGWCRTPQQGIQ